MSKKRGADLVYQFKISLQGVRPPIWRRIQILGDCTFWDLHVAIQDAMGWEMEHLHAFNLPSLGRDTDIGVPEEEEGSFGAFLDGVWGRRTLPGWKVRVADYLNLNQPVAFYTYDFGDDWVHKLKLEKILPREEGPYPRCLAGKRACPPEDCGGVGGYAALVAGEYEEGEELFGTFDPEAFDPNGVSFNDPAAMLQFVLAER
ncbi:MAG: plasmid pRiA4b ORF-3 family protein [Thermaerobacter sp.]|nr:plasmid pRiA4b ORF-3 family protein [Thermaerobacter sp.]